MAALTYVDFTVYSLIILLVLLSYATRNFKYWKARGVPYLKPIPFFGNCFNLLTFRTTIGEQMADIYFKSKDPFVGFFIGDRPYLLVRNPELIKSILIKDFDHFMDRTIAHNYEDDPLGAHILFTVANPAWKSIRPRVTAFFSSGRIKQMFKFMQQLGIELEEYIAKKIGNQEVDVKNLAGNFAVDVISSCAFGIQSNSLELEHIEYNTYAKRIYDFQSNRGIQMNCSFFLPTIFSLLNMTFLDRNSAKFLDKFFLETIEKREESKTVRNDLIDLLIMLKNETKTEEEGKLDQNKLISQAIQFLIAGVETTSSTISYALFELCYNTDVQDKLRSEINKMLTKYGWSYEGIQSCDYLKWTVQETLRKYPVLPFLDRTCTANYKIPNSDVVIEKGIRLYIPLMGLQYDPLYFEEPEKFQPERFSNDNKNWPNNVYLPFGTGPRNCIGERFGYLTSMMGLAHIISKYKVEKSENTPKSVYFNPKGFLLSSETGIPMKFTMLE